MTAQSGTVLLLRTTDADGQSYGGFQWPREIGAVVEAPDWSPDPTCGHGLHGLLWGEGDVELLSHDSAALWWVVEAEAEHVVDLGGKVKVPRVTVRLVGTREDAVAWLTAHAPGHATCFAHVMAGDEGTATAGDRGTATAGDLGTATAGDRGTATAGYRGTATAGDRGTATAGHRGTATAGEYGTLVMHRWDGKRYRVSVAYVGEDGIEPNVPYRLDDQGRFVRVPEVTR